MRRIVFALLLALFAPVGFAPRAAWSADPVSTTTPALALGETRPPETTLGNPALPTAQAVWIEMIRGAKHTLDIEQFYLSHRDGEATQPVLDEIGRAAARGVQVRLILDAGMSRTYPQPADSLDALPNVTLRRVDYKKLAGGVQHSKFMVVDGTDAWLGSQNLDWRALSQIHEVGIRMREPRLARALGAVFDTDWGAADTTQAFAPGAAPAIAWPLQVGMGKGRTAQVWLGASPRKTNPSGIPWDRDLIEQRIAAAKKSVVVQTLQYGVSGYGATDSTLHKALIAAAARGVKVRVIVSDWSLGGRNEDPMRDLARHDVEVRISRVPDWSKGYISFARVEHCKYMAVDGEWTWVGTSNWEPSYFSSTRNVGLTVRDRGLAAQAEAIFAADWNSPTATPWGPDTHLPKREHGETPPPGQKLY